ncbi:M56 family metallopeptidase [Danxiaibacter flavus]|uniref:M56 family metallopeptidase n=1 Tax=Danxiaibacter flavus TaxID=3049108 RepID=A0ABV3ZJ25_9BACT|nr:M56 family metallopeptidase [Chitinophagaceae bacterium DXS]
MTTLLTSLSVEVLVRAFSKMLLHSLWQGLLLCIATSLVILFTRKKQSAVRYNIISFLFFIFLLTCLYTFFQSLAEERYSILHAEPGTLSNNTTGFLEQPGLTYLMNKLLLFCTANANTIVLAWFMVFLLKCIQISIGFTFIHRVQTHHLSTPEPKWQAALITLSKKIHLQRTVVLMESAITKVPVVIGHLKPVIYMPVGLLNHLPQDQVEAVLLHELAHIRRNDYLVNIVQQIMQTIFFFNPGFLWVSAVLKQEREHCCDDIALAQTNSRKQFVEALVNFTKHSLYGSSYTTAFPGTKKQLVQRVMRITYNRNNSLSLHEKIFFTLSICACFVLAGIAGKSKIVEPQNTKGFISPVMATTTSTEKKEHVIITHDETSIQNAEEKNRKHEPDHYIEQNATKTVDEDSRAEAVKETDDPQIYEYEKQLVLTQNGHTLLLSDEAQVDKDWLQAEKDRQQADADRVMAGLDRQRAERDLEQSIKDREKAEKDRQQADVDRARSEEDRKKADRDRRQAFEASQTTNKNKTLPQQYKTPAVSVEP